MASNSDTVRPISASGSRECERAASAARPGEPRTFTSQSRTAAQEAVMTKLAEVVEATAIRPFQVNVPEAELTDLRRRISATRLPEKETVTDFSQGVPLATVQKLASYWATEYDWRKVEARLNAVPQLHHRDRRSRHPLHSRALEARERLARHRHARLAGLDPRAAQAHRAADQPDRAWRHRRGCVPRGHSLDAGLWLLGQADRHRLGARAHRARLGRADEAPRIHEVTWRKAATGARSSSTDGRAGAAGVARHSHQHGQRLSSRHRRGGLFRRTGAGGSLSRREARVRATELRL